MSHVIVRRRWVRRQSLDGTRRPVEVWEPMPGLATHATARAAILAFIVAMEPALAGKRESSVLLHWPSFRRAHDVKTARVAGE